jgi:4-diphosphocytidyl-2-C-methyl-D-erythritol kinase
VTTRVRLLAPAKLNLALHVGPRRSDGYHELDTLFQAIDLADELEVRAAGTGIELTVEGEDAGPAADNLVVRAARAFFAVADMDRATGVRARLVKRIPVGAGLGGGSSDAAAMLRALDRIFPDRLDPLGLAELAAAIGSDVPFFLGDSTLARGLGRGERLELITPLPRAPGLVVMPDAHILTADAYAALDRSREGDGAMSRPRWKVPKRWEDVAAAAANDFQEVIAAQVPEVARALAALVESAPRFALLSGSGAAVFALYATEADTDRAREQVEGARVGRVFRVRTLTSWPWPRSP